MGSAQAVENIQRLIDEVMKASLKADTNRYFVLVLRSSLSFDDRVLQQASVFARCRRET